MTERVAGGPLRRGRLGPWYALFPLPELCKRTGLSAIRAGSIASFLTGAVTTVSCSETWLVPGGVGLKCFLPPCSR